MSRFDFRDMLGGAAAKVGDNPDLADGANAEHAAGLCAHMLAKDEGVDTVVEMMTRSMIATANVNGLCCGALAALIVERLIDAAQRESGDVQAAHVIAEIAAVLERAAGER